MSVRITIPKHLEARIAERAVAQGVTLEQYVCEVLDRDVSAGWHCPLMYPTGFASAFSLHGYSAVAAWRSKKSGELRAESGEPDGAKTLRHKEFGVVRRCGWRRVQDAR